MTDYRYVVIRSKIYRVWANIGNALDEYIYMYYICAWKNLNILMTIGSRSLLKKRDSMMVLRSIPRGTREQDGMTGISAKLVARHRPRFFLLICRSFYFIKRK